MKSIDQERISELVIDEWIWVVFIILSMLNITGDESEKKYCYTNSCGDKIRAKKIFTLTVFVSFLIYFYLAYKNCYKYQKARSSNGNTTLVGIRFFSSILIVIASCLLLIAQLSEKNVVNPSIQ